MKLIVNWPTVLNNDLWKGNIGTRNRFFWSKPILNIQLVHRSETNPKLSKKKSVKHIFVSDIILSIYFVINKIEVY